MKIKVRLFSDFRKVTGRKDLEIEIEREMTIKELMKLLVDSFPEMKKLKYYSILLNGNYSKETETLKDSDVIDLFTVILGG